MNSSETGPVVSLDTLLQHRGWVRALARSLVADPQRADDVEQETWRIVLERPPQHGGSLRAWFRAVVRNVARKSVRGEKQQIRVTAAAQRPEGAKAAADVVAEAEIQARVVRAVLELEEPYRSTVLLRYFHGLDPREIAARTDAPVETVKTRLKRALAQLRDLLGAEIGDDRGAWCLLLLGFRMPKTSAVGTAASTTMVLGGTAMAIAKKAAVAAVVLLVLGSASWRFLQRSSATNIAIAPNRATTASAAAITDRRDVAPRQAPTTAAVQEFSGAIDVVVTLPRGGPAEGAIVDAFEAPRIATAEERDRGGEFLVAAPTPVAHAVTNAQGHAHLRGFARAGRWTVVAGTSGFATASAGVRDRDLDSGTPIRLRLSAAATLTGRVLDGDGHAIPFASVFPFDPSVRVPAARAQAPEAKCDATGRWRLTGLAHGTVVLWAARPGGIAVSAAAVKVPDVRELDLVVPFDGEIRGRVTAAATGSPVVGATIEIDGWNGRRTCRATVESDESGGWSLSGIPSACVALTVRARGYLPERRTSDARLVHLVRGRPMQVDVALRPGVPLAGRVTGPDGPVGGVAVHAYCVGNMNPNPIATAADGTYRFDALAPGEVAVVVDRGRLVQEGFGREPHSDAVGGRAPKDARVVVPESGEARLDIRLVTRAEVEPASAAAQARIFGRVSAPVGADVADAVVEVVSDEEMRRGPWGNWAGDAWRGAMRTPVAADGSISIPTTRGTHWVRASIPGVAWSRPTRTEITDAKPEAHVDLVLESGGTIEGVVLGRGSPVSGAVLSVDRKRADKPGRTLVQGGVTRLSGAADFPDIAATTDAEGRFRIPPQGDGFVRLVVRSPGFAPTAVQVAATGRDPLRIDLLPASRIRGRVRFADGRPAPQVVVMLQGRYDRDMQDTRTDDVGEFAFDAADDMSGNYVLQVFPVPGGAAIRQRYFSRVAAQTEPIEIVVEPGLSISGHLRDPQGRGLPASMVQIYREGDGPLLQRAGTFVQTASDDPEASFEFLGLAEGRYSLVVQPCRFLTGVAYPPFRVDGVAAGATQLDLVAQPGLAVEGRLVDRDGQPFTGVRICLESPRRLPGEPAPDIEYRWSLASLVGNDGGFRVTGLPAGRFHFVLYERDAPTTPAPIQVEGDPIVNAGDSGLLLVAGAAASIRGVVTSEGRPAKALVTLSLESGDHAQTAWSDVSGRFLFLSLAPDAKYRVTAALGAAGTAEVDGVAAGAHDLRLEIAPGLRGGGRLVGSDGKALRGVEVRLHRAASPPTACARTDDDGRFAIGGLSDGEYRIEFNAAIDPTINAADWRDCGSLRAGETVAVIQVVR